MKELKKNLYDYALMYYVSNDHLRPVMNMPGITKNYAYASDSHSVIRINLNKINEDYNSKTYPDVEKVFSTEKLTYKNSFQVDDLISLLAEYKWRYKRMECEKCNGTGTIKCDCCDNDGDCKRCNGTGELQTLYPLMIKEFQYAEFIQVGNSTFYANQLDRLLTTSMQFGIKEIFYFNNPEKNQTIFQINKDIHILIMNAKGSDEIEYNKL